ncbi:MAG: pilus assembly protein TadG-related protein [Granulosicoccaceae bacterium]
MRTYQRGQVMPLGLALAAAGALTALVLFNTGQVVSDKTRLANTADAAAYSGLIWQARALNFQAYTNRAMVANQVAMAQAVSLKSWALYGKIATSNINTVLGGVPFVGAVTNAMAVTMRTAENLVSPISAGMLSVSNAVNGALSKAQTAMFASSFAATPEIIRNVVKANDSRFDSDTAYSIASQLRNVKDWESFTEGYDTSNRQAMKARIDVINRSRDPWSKTRNWDFFNSYMPVFGIAKFRLEKRAETRLIEVTTTQADDRGNQTSSQTNYEWKAKDSLSLQFQWWTPTLRGIRWKRFETPIGWGEAIANNQVGDGSIEPCPMDDNDGRARCAKWLGHNKLSELAADNGVRDLNGNESREKLGATFNGIRAYRSLTQEIEQQQDPRLVLRVEVAMPINDIRSSESFLNSETFKASVKAPGEVLTSVSTAEVYYQRPEDSLSVEGERANGYNPYWDVRLAATSKAERFAALSLRAQTSTALAPSVSAEAMGNYIAPSGNVQGDVQSELDSIARQLATADVDSAEYAQLQARETQLQAVQNGVANTGAYSDVNAIAQAFDVDPAELVNSQAYQNVVAGVGEEALRAYVDNKVATLGLDVLKGQVEAELKAALEDAAAAILAGAMQGLGGSLGNAAQAVDDINGKIQGYEDQYNQVAGTIEDVRTGAENQLAALEAELDRVKDSIAEQYAEKTEELQTELTEATQPFLDEIAILEGQLTAELDIPLTLLQIEGINAGIAAANVNIRDLQDTHKTILAQDVMDIVNSSTDVMRIDLEQAEQLIKFDKGEFQLDVKDLEVSDADLDDE